MIMRDISFRAKRTDNGEWVYGYVRRQYDNEGVEYVILTDTSGHEYEVNPATVGQFTDVHDKNGDAIYEGDILHFIGTRKDNYGVHYNRPVVYHQGAFKFRLEDGTAGACIGGGNAWSWEIAGNIHDEK